VSFLGIFVSNFGTLSLQRSFFQIETLLYYKILQAGNNYFLWELSFEKSMRLKDYVELGKQSEVFGFEDGRKTSQIWKTFADHTYYL
jgi:hypothetical protein